MPNWKKISSLESDFRSEETLVEFLREKQIILRGEHCIDYTLPGQPARVDPILILRDFILNSRFAVSADKVYANDAYGVPAGVMSYEMFSFVEADGDQYASRLNPGKVGRREVHDWKGEIRRLFERELRTWDGGQNEFFEHLRQVIRHRLGISPEVSALKRKLATDFRKAMREDEGGEQPPEA